jgi:hypothetical protein
VAGLVKTNERGLRASPMRVFTLIFPECALLGTVATICVVDGTLNTFAVTPPNFTHVAPPRFAPRIVTLSPAFACIGANDEIRGVSFAPDCVVASGCALGLAVGVVVGAGAGEVPNCVAPLPPGSPEPVNMTETTPPGLQAHWYGPRLKPVQEKPLPAITHVPESLRPTLMTVRAGPGTNVNELMTESMLLFCTEARYSPFPCAVTVTSALAALTAAPTVRVENSGTRMTQTATAERGMWQLIPERPPES